MNDRDAAAWEVHCLLKELGVNYAIIGGSAVQIWGEPRFTQDVDLTVATPLDEPTLFVQRVLDHFTPRIENALEFSRRNRVLLIQSSKGCPIDISLGLPGYEDEVMHRTVEVELEPGKSVYMCSAEDLIIHKAIAGRPQDLRDIESVVYRQHDRLNADYIRQWLREFSDILGLPEVIERFEVPWLRVGHKSQNL